MHERHAPGQKTIHFKFFQVLKGFRRFRGEGEPAHRARKPATGTRPFGRALGRPVNTSREPEEITQTKFSLLSPPNRVRTVFGHSRNSKLSPEELHCVIHSFPLSKTPLRSNESYSLSDSHETKRIVVVVFRGRLKTNRSAENATARNCSSKDNVKYMARGCPNKTSRLALPRRETLFFNDQHRGAEAARRT